MAKLIDENNFPYNLFYDILSPDDRYIPPEDETGLNSALLTLTEQERQYILMYYRDRMSMRMIGSVVKLTTERVRQVLQKARRKLSSLPRIRLIFGDMGTSRLIEEYAARIRKERELFNKYRDIIASKASELDVDIVTVNEMKVLGVSIADIPGLSVRSYNCLARSGNYYLSTLVRNIAENPDYLRGVRNLGEKSAKEIEGYLNYYLNND